MHATQALFLMLALPATLLPRWEGAAPPAPPTRLVVTETGLLLGTEAGLYERRARAERDWRLVLARDGVRDLARAGEGVLIATGEGLYEWSAATQRALEIGLGAGAEARALAVDADGGAWIATAAGLYSRAPGAREFTREPGLPPGEVHAVATAGGELFVAREDALWSRPRGGSFAVRASGVEPEWSALCGAVELAGATLLCVPAGVWHVSSAGARRVELALGQIFALARAGGRVFVAAEGGLYAFDEHELERGAGRQELAGPARGLALAGDELLVATERGLAAFALGAGSGDDGAARGLRAPPPARPGERASQIALLQRAVLRYLELSPARLSEIESRARRSGLMPELRASLIYDRASARDGDHDDVVTSGERYRLFDTSTQRDRGYDVGVSLVWDLAELASPDDALAVSRERRSLVTLRDQVLERVNHLYFQRLRALAQLEVLAPEDAARRAELELDAAEIAAQLDAWSGGMFSRLERSSPPETQREP